MLSYSIKVIKSNNMRKQTPLLKLFLYSILFGFCIPVSAKNNDADFSLNPVPPDLKTLENRLDNLESYTSNLQYIVNHLEKNVVMLQVTPLSEAHASFAEVCTFASTAVSEALNFNPQNFRYTLSNASKYFSESAFTKLQKFLKNNNIIVDSKMHTIANHAVLMAQPTVTKTYVDQRISYSNRERDVYVWDLEMPIFIEIKNKNGSSILTKNVQLEIVRASIEHSPDQMLIDNISLKDYKAGI